MKRLFFGGIHPKYNKEMSAKAERLMTVTPREAVIPMRQHIGAPCEPLVKVGDRVLMGQKIGDGEGLCVPVHASVSGRVIAIEARPHTVGHDVMAIVIENDRQDTPAEFKPMEGAYADMDTDDILHAIREAGIVGMGGAAFPGNVKALSAMGKVDTLIANACECEPYITADDKLMRTEPEHVMEGMAILMKVLSPGRSVIAVEDNKPDAIEKLKKLLPEYPGVELAVLPTKYPQGSEKQLIQSVTGREVPPGSLPAGVGCAVFNVSTFAAVYRAVRLGMPLIQRIVTVTGEGVNEPQNFIVRIGTPFAEVIDAAGGLKDGAARVISGGPMMGFSQDKLSVPVVKATNSVLCLMEDTNGAAEEPVCLRCAKCVGACPMKLQPLYMYRYSLAKDTDELKRLNITDCIECGCCAYVCPGKLPLVEKFRVGKKILREANSK